LELSEVYDNRRKETGLHTMQWLSIVGFPQARVVNSSFVAAAASIPLGFVGIKNYHPELTVLSCIRGQIFKYPAR
jgi:hypothetical protein